MKIKTISIFVVGLISWLLLTNYQLVAAKFTNLTNPTKQNTEVVTANIDVESLQSEMSAEDLSSNLESSTQETSTTVVADINNDINILDTELETVNVESAESETHETISTEKITDLDPAVEHTKEQVTESLSETQVATSENNTNYTNPSSTNKGQTNQAPISNPWMQTMQAPKSFPMMNPNMMNPAMYMNPMGMMMPMIMNMMGPMMNPAMMMNPMGMMNHPINAITHPHNMNAMMMSMDPKLMFGMFGQPSKKYLEGEVPEQLPVISMPGFPTQSHQNWPKNKVSPGISREAKKNAFQTAMAMSPLSMRDMMGIMAEKIPVAEDVSWDDAVEAMKLRANEVNFKFVGSSPLWKEIEAVTGEPSAKVEMFRFCDAAIARKILDEVPEFIVFLPCKIALLEDGEGKLWVMTMDWDVAWLDYAQNPNSHLPKEIRADAQRIRDNLNYIMEGAATGDF